MSISFLGGAIKTIQYVVFAPSKTSQARSAQKSAIESSEGRSVVATKILIYAEARLARSITCQIIGQPQISAKDLPGKREDPIRA